MKINLVHVFGACMWIHTKAAISLRPKDMENFISKLHLITEAVNKPWDFLYGTHLLDTTELHGTSGKPHCEVPAL